jgi:hypothetical protein
MLEATMARQTTRRSTESGFAVVQALIVFAIAGMIAAIAVPVYATKAKDSVLRQNTASLVLQVKGCLALDLEPTYTITVDQDSDDTPGSVSTAIARALRAQGAGSWGHYVNPLSGSDAILLQSSLPTEPDDVRPAVWMTDDPSYAYADFEGSAVTRSQLAGTLLVVFASSSGRASAMEIYYVDAAGQRSATATSLAL